MTRSYIGRSVIVAVMTLLGNVTGAQTFSWASYSNATNTPIGATIYNQTITTGTVSTTVYANIASSGNASGATDNTIFKNSSPKYITTESNGGCGTSNSFQSGVAIYVDWAEYGTAASSATTQYPNVLTTIDFRGGTNGVCGPVNFSIYDINSDGTGTFKDWVEITAYDKNGTYIVPTIGSNTQNCNFNMGTYTNATSPGPLQYRGSSSCTCWPDYITLGASGTVIAVVYIKYYPDHTGSYASSGRNPAPQYIVISNFSTGGVGCASIALPVTLTSFKGECVNGKKHFSWSTATEENNDHFILQQSANGESYEDVVKVTGNGTSLISHNYEASVPENTQGYYRLKQVDRNGAERYSDWIFVSCTESSMVNMKLYPNPSHYNSTLDFYSRAESTLQITISDIGGKVVSMQSYQAAKDYNSVELNTGALDAGVYYIQVSDPNNFSNSKTFKFIKE